MTLAAISFLVVLLGGTAPLMAGELAEQWTAGSLRPLRAHGWKLANHVLFNGGDADHVLVGPGGVFVVETKWRREPWKSSGPDLDRDAAIQQVRDKARSVAFLLRPVGVTPRPVVVRWVGRGLSSPDTASIQVFDETTVVPGGQLEAWALRRGRNALTPEQVEQAWAFIADHATRNEDFENERSPVPPSFDSLAMRAFFSVLVGLGTFSLLVQAIRWVPLAIYVAVVTLVGVCGLAARSRVRPGVGVYLLSATTGCLAVLAFVAGALLISWTS
jgi:hypothetical protein